ncbi:RNA ligase [Caudoviricetes sp.]|nr:RNA ligase [Caudoviricetes sp.]UOF81852.1 RNA ligase [Caudoviricetes sp.]
MYTCVVKKGEWKKGDLAAYIEPDYVVPDVPSFAFLQGKRRIGAKRLRGVWSEGLLVRAPEGATAGQDVMDALGITRWESPADRGTPSGFGKSSSGGSIARVPEILRDSAPKYDLENILKYPTVISPGEPIFATEKLHGTNARFCALNDLLACDVSEPLFCGSRNQWRAADPTNVYHEAVRQNRWIEGWCKAHPNMALYGEIFGDVQDLKYGAEKGQYNFRAFDVWDLHKRRWINTPHEIWPQMQWAPLRYTGPYDLAALRELAEQDSVFGGIQEGLVIVPQNGPRYHPEIGWTKLKLVSRRYLGRP